MQAYEGLRAAMVSLCEALGRALPTEVLDAEKEGAADRDGAAYTRIGIISGTVGMDCVGGSLSYRFLLSAAWWVTIGISSKDTCSKSHR
eukprot:1159500-Pelagomonas_calceolata.AAC.17